MKNLSKVIAFFMPFLLLIPNHSAFAQIDIGIQRGLPTATSQTVEFVYKPVIDYSVTPNNIWNSQVFTMRWPLAYGQNIVASVSNQSAFVFMLGAKSSDANYYYQIFETTGIATQAIGTGINPMVLRVTFAPSITSLQVSNMELITSTAALPNVVVDDIGGTASINLAITGTDEFRTFDPAKPTATLPVEFTFFRAKAIENTYILTNWATASELSNAYFEVEKVKTIGEQVQIVGRKMGANNSNKTINYQLIDKNPMSGESYYRVAQYDNDGKRTNTEWQKVSINPELKQLFDYTVFPNPANDVLSIRYEGELENECLVALYDVCGKLQHTQTVGDVEGNKTVNLNVNHLEKGVYFCRFNGKTINFIKN